MALDLTLLLVQKKHDTATVVCYKPIFCYICFVSNTITSLFLYLSLVSYKITQLTFNKNIKVSKLKAGLFDLINYHDVYLCSKSNSYILPFHMFHVNVQIGLLPNTRFVLDL